MEKIVAHDLFESSYYLMNHCEIDSLNFYQFDGRIDYQLTIKGLLIPELQCQYFNGLAVVNLVDFRMTFTHLNMTISQAEKKFSMTGKTSI